MEFFGGMKTVTVSKSHNSLLIRRAYGVGIILLGTCLFAAQAARAGLTFSLQVSRSYNGSYVCYSSLATNSTTPAPAFGTYVISSPTNAWSETSQVTASGVSFVGYNHLVNYPDFVSFLRQITNGNWSILVTN